MRSALGSVSDRYRVRRSGDRITVVFDGVIDEAIGRAAAEEFLVVMGSDQVELALDIRNVSGYASAARKAWQNALLPHRHQIRSLCVASSSAVTRMGAQVLATAIGVPCHIASAGEIEAGLQ